MLREGLGERCKGDCEDVQKRGGRDVHEERAVSIGMFRGVWGGIGMFRWLGIGGMFRGGRMGKIIIGGGGGGQHVPPYFLYAV